jgi:hypothetical protein
VRQSLPFVVSLALIPVSASAGPFWASTLQPLAGLRAEPAARVLDASGIPAAGGLGRIRLTRPVPQPETTAGALPADAIAGGAHGTATIAGQSRRSEIPGTGPAAPAAPATTRGRTASTALTAFATEAARSVARTRAPPRRAV